MGDWGKVAPDREWLRARAEQALSATAAEWGVSPPTMLMWYRRYGVPVKLQQINPHKLPSPGREWLAERLHLTLDEIGRQAPGGGVSGPVVRRWLDEAGLEYQAKGSARMQQGRRVRQIATRDWLLARVDVPALEIAAELECGDRLVYDLMYEFDIDYQPVRSKSAPKGPRVQPWDGRDCPNCALLRECRAVEPTLDDLPCEAIPMVRFEPEFAGRERVTCLQ